VLVDDHRPIDDVVAAGDRPDMSSVEAPPPPPGVVELPASSEDRKLWRGLLKELEITVSEKSPSRVHSTIGNALVALHHPMFQDLFMLNEREGAVYLRRPPPCREFKETVAERIVGQPEDHRAYPRRLEDGDLFRLCAVLTALPYYSMTPPSFGISAVHAALTIVAESASYDPVQDHIRGLPAWDGVERLGTMLARYFGADDDPLNREFGRRFMISAIARAMRPGCKVDHTLVLVGAQGAGKSTAAAILGGEFFGDGMGGDLKGKDEQMYVRAKWIIELGELAQLRRNEVETTKQFLTKVDDEIRDPYGRMIRKHLRRCVFIGTTNDETFLKDSTGNRRFWPVKTGKVDTDALTKDRDQLWAEALLAFERGEPWHLSRTVELDARARQSGHTALDEWVPIIANWLREKAHAHLGGTSIAQVAGEALGIERSRLNKPEQDRIRSALQVLGWEQHSDRRQRLREDVHGRPVTYDAPEAVGAAFRARLWVPGPNAEEGDDHDLWT
jgi:predicted P-loop ATPase